MRWVRLLAIYMRIPFLGCIWMRGISGESFPTRGARINMRSEGHKMGARFRGTVLGTAMTVSGLGM